MNRLAVAEQALKQAVALGGNQPDLHFNLGVMAEQRGQKAVAAREYRAEVAAHPDSLGAWVNLGLLERQAGRVEAALTAFERAAAAKADAIEGPYLMAETLLAVGRRADAERWAAEALRRGPNDPRAGELLQRTASRGGTRGLRKRRTVELRRHRARWPATSSARTASSAVSAGFSTCRVSRSSSRACSTPSPRRPPRGEHEPAGPCHLARQRHVSRVLSASAKPHAAWASSWPRTSA